jgi:hypothetical protein
MARFQFNVRGFVASCTARAVVSQRTLRALNLAGADDPPQGPGWFDSSWELIRGLEVHEGLPFDARLHDLLRAGLRGERDPRPGSAPALRHEPHGAGVAQATPYSAIGHASPNGRPSHSAATEAAHLDPFSAFGIDGLALL